MDEQYWARRDWVACADRMLLALRPYASSDHAGIRPPGKLSGLGRDVDLLEGFTRSFLLASFRLAGEPDNDPYGYRQWYAQGIEAGVDSNNQHRWLRPDEHPQAKVEAASLALCLDLTRDIIWNQLDTDVQRNVVSYLSSVVGDDTFVPNNWLWFRVVIETFLRSVDGPFSQRDLDQDLARHDSFIRAEGWLSDGVRRNFDHYNGWALQLYPTLWSRMAGAADLAAHRVAADRQRLARFLQDAMHLVGADGGPLIQGRSLIYRFAAAACYWVGAIAEVDTVPPGQLRWAAEKIVRHFVQRGAPDSDGLLTPGWFGPQNHLAQSYSGASSPYWAAKGFLGLALPEQHPVWQSEKVALPAEEKMTEVITIEAPGWLVDTTDGIVRVINHGTDHGEPGLSQSDSPWYSRLGYSSATFPVLNSQAWANPADNAVVLVDATGRTSHRSGFERLPLQVTGNCSAGAAASTGQVHWLTPAGEHGNVGEGLPGQLTRAGQLTVVSVVRDGCEVRLTHAADLCPQAKQLHYLGWPGAQEAHSHLAPLTPGAEMGWHSYPSEITTGEVVRVPWAAYPAVEGWTAALVELSASPTPSTPPEVFITENEQQTQIRVAWNVHFFTEVIIER